MGGWVGGVVLPIIKSFTKPDSSVRNFGEWIVGEGWDTISNDMLPTEQAAALENLVNDKLNLFCPEKVMKLSSQVKPFITAELKAIHRRSSREYTRRGSQISIKNWQKNLKLSLRQKQQSI